MRTKVLGLFLVVALLVFAVPSFASAQPITAGVVGECEFVGGVSLQAVSFTVVAWEPMSISLDGGDSIQLESGEVGTLVSDPVPAGTFVWLEINGQPATGYAHAANCAPAVAPPAAQDRPGDSFVCAVPMPPGYGHPQYAQSVVGEELLSWNGYVAVVEGDLQLFAHPGADQVGPWRVTADDWEDTFDIQRVGPNVCQFVQ